jgi:type II secretory pathway pseudopilin PulG
MVTLIFISLVAVAALVVWQMGRQAAKQEQAVREDVQAAFGVWQQAVARRDRDLLGTLLMDGEARWTATQRDLLTSGRALDRSGVGLTLVGDVRGDQAAGTEIDVSSDWRTAEIRFPLTYSSRDDDGRARDVRLEETVSLVREGSRWLLRRPDEAFWGIWRTRAGKLAAVTYRDRDAAVAERFLDDLDRDLSAVCARVSSEHDCPAGGRLDVRLESEAAVLLEDTNRERPAFLGRTFILPSPTLVGNPLDDEGYQALYRAYTRPILSTFEASIASPVTLPEQLVSMICFNRYGTLPRLFSYDPAADTWSAELEDDSFRFLTASDDDQQIALRQHLPREPYRLRIVAWSNGRAAVLYDATYAALTDHSLGWLSIGGQTGLLLADYQGTTRQPAYRLIESGGADGSCLQADCPLQALDGFPKWSPDGTHSLLQVEGRLYLGDGHGRARLDLGQGHDAFWLDDERFGFIRPPGDQGLQAEEIVLGASNGSDLAAVWSTAALDSSLSGANADSRFFIQHVALGGRDRHRLLLYGRQYAGDDSLYAVFSLPLEVGTGQVMVVGPARLELVLDRTPAGLPSAADPNGHAPFVVSSDGRWLTAAYLAEQGSDSWVILATEIGQDNGFRYSADYPGYSFNQPFFDWSADGRWLLIVDETFIRLVAPEAGYERIVAHDKRNCSYPAWLDHRADE